MRLLLISNSYSFGQEYLDHALDEIQDFVRNSSRILFFPYAVHDYDSYYSLVKNKLGKLGYRVITIHQVHDPQSAINNADAFFIGGGNTFRLLKTLHEKKYLDMIRGKVLGGTPYIGSSAGTNVAAPTIKTTNDMPIVFPPTLDALNLIPFQINPHYLDIDPKCQVMIESREKRILEYHEENSLAVLGLREDCYLRIEKNLALLKGKSNARLFEKGLMPKEITPVADVSFLLSQKQVSI